MHFRPVDGINFRKGFAIKEIAGFTVALDISMLSLVNSDRFRSNVDFVELPWKPKFERSVRFRSGRSTICLRILKGPRPQLIYMDMIVGEQYNKDARQKGFCQRQEIIDVPFVRGRAT